MTPSPPHRTRLIVILGALNSLIPFSVDMYLPAFPQIASAFGIPIAQMSLTLSSFFIGLAVGQLFYGPMLDRFGRKRPLYVSLLLYIAATIGCVFSRSLEMLMFFRCLQALGGCGTNIVAMALVRDHFTGKESAKVFSFLILILGASPLLAPTLGGVIASTAGWTSIFGVLAFMATSLLAASFFLLPQGRPADAGYSLHPVEILRGYGAILGNRSFFVYAMAGALSLSGLFVYLAASPLIFMETYHVTPRVYGWIFGILAIGFVGASQFNFLLLRRFSNEQILLGGLIALSTVGVTFFVGSVLGWFGMTGTMVLLFLFLASFGIANPNAASLAMAPFEHNAGSASSMLGFLQMVIGTVLTIGVSLIKTDPIQTTAALFACTGLLALSLVWFGRGRVAHHTPPPPEPVI